MTILKGMLLEDKTTAEKLRAGYQKKQFEANAISLFHLTTSLSQMTVALLIIYLRSIYIYIYK